MQTEKFKALGTSDMKYASQLRCYTLSPHGQDSVLKCKICNVTSEKRYCLFEIYGAVIWMSLPNQSIDFVFVRVCSLLEDPAIEMSTSITWVLLLYFCSNSTKSLHFSQNLPLKKKTPWNVQLLRQKYLDAKRSVAIISKFQIQISLQPRARSPNLPKLRLDLILGSNLHTPISHFLYSFPLNF